MCGLPRCMPECLDVGAASNAHGLQLLSPPAADCLFQVPGAKYMYRVAGSDRQYSFIASPQVQPQHKFTFAAYGDLGDPIHFRAKSPG